VIVKINCCSECYSLLNGAVLNTAVCRLCFTFQSLYGARKSHPPTLSPNASFDAIFECPAGVIYVLKGELNTIYCKILISHSGVAEDSSSLGCEAVFKAI